MTRSLEIALTVDPNIPVPPPLYGGIERILDFLATGLEARGHRVTLFAHPESRTAGTLVPYGVPPHRGTVPRLRELWQVGAGLVRRRGRLDVVHSFGRLAALLPVLPLRGLPKIQTYSRDAVPWRSVAIAERLAGRSLLLTGLSTSVYHGDHGEPPPAGEWRTVFAGVDTSRYVPTATVAADAPLAFLGRIERIKGTHEAIEIARLSGRRLIIAGNVARSAEEPRYFEEHVQPHIDGDRVQYIGPVDDAGKNALLGAAAALLMPIRWREAFGIVMAEATACGAPIIAYPYGSVPEVVRDGVNGFVVKDVAEGAAAVAKVATLDRRAVRRDCEARFGHEAIIGQYETLYHEMVERVSDR